MPGSGAGVPQGPAVAPRPDPGSLKPLSPERYRLQVTLGAEAQRALRRAQDLTRHTNPRGDLAVIVETALLEYVERLEARKLGKLRRRASAHDDAGKDTTAPTPARATTDRRAASAQASSADGVPASRLETATSRTTSPRPADASSAPGQHALGQVEQPAAASAPGQPAARRRRPTRAELRAVVERDGARCTYVSPDGRRCSEKAFLEIHHEHAFALGGVTTVPNLTLRCRSHNMHQAVLDFGAQHVADHVRRRRAETRRAER